MQMHWNFFIALPHLVFQTDKGEIDFHQPFKERDFQIEVLGQVIDICTRLQLKEKR